MIIDPHVHCRDGAQRHKETIEHVFSLCDKAGVDMVFDMPNTDPPLLTEHDIEERLKLVPASAKDRYRLFVGITAEPSQIMDAARLATENPAVAGIKMYAGSSVGSLALLSEQDQQQVYATLTEASYAGVLAVHCEKESCFGPDFDPASPESHCQARPAQAEVKSVKDQVSFAHDACFKGVLHVCHVSCPESVQLVDTARRTMRITCGATPHHLLWDSSLMRGPAGLMYKVNPPLREPEEVTGLREALKEGRIDWIESDHAPHAVCEKLFPPHMSGFPSLSLYRGLVREMLPSWGLSAEQISKITCENIISAFGERILG